MKDKDFDKDYVEKRLNSDDGYRERFMAEPVKTLREAGLSLSDENAKKVISQLSELKDKRLPSGASIAANGIVISISKSF